jgi:hypothetical protein
MNGVAMRCWIGIFGDEVGHVEIVARFRDGVDAATVSQLKSSVASAQWRDDLPIDPFWGRSFRLTIPGELRYAGGISGAVFFNGTGVVPIPKDDPSLMVFMVPVDELPSDSTGAEKLIRTKMSDNKEYYFASRTDTNFANLRGFALAGEVIEARSGMHKAFNINIFAVKPDQVLILQGTVARKDRDKWIPIFEQISESIQLTGQPNEN